MSIKRWLKDRQQQPVLRVALDLTQSAYGAVLSARTRRAAVDVPAAAGGWPLRVVPMPAPQPITGSERRAVRRATRSSSAAFFDPEGVRAAINPRTKAIIPVHIGGVPCDMDALRAIADEHGIAIVEDAAHAHGSTLHGRYMGTLGELGCFSFGPPKSIRTGEGGALPTSDPALFGRARMASSRWHSASPRASSGCAWTPRWTHALSALTSACLAALPVFGQVCMPQVIVPTPASSLMWFGNDVVLEEGRVLVAAPQDDFGDGAVYAYQRVPSTGLWAQTQRIKPSVVWGEMKFGVPMMAEGNTAVIAASQRGTSAVFRGQVYIFEFDTGTGRWVETQVLSEPNTGFYGTMVHLSGSMLAITDSWDGGQSVGWFGKVYVYERDAVTGQFVSKGVIESIERHSNNRFANDAVFLNSETLLLGDAAASVGGLRGCGSVYTFEWDASAGRWKRVARLISPRFAFAGAFGLRLEWDGRQLLVTETRNTQRPEDGGGVHVFEPGGGGQWDHVQELTPRNVSLGFAFSTALTELNDGRAWVRRIDGQPGTVPTTYLDQWVRDDLSGRWTLTGTFTDPLVPGITDFGAGVEAEGTTLLVGSAWSIIAGFPQGRAYAYDLTDCFQFGDTFCDPSPPTSTGETPSLRFYGFNSVAVNKTLLRASGLPEGTLAITLASRALGSSQPAMSLAPLCLGGSIGRFEPHMTSASTGTLSHRVDLSSIPGPLGSSAVQRGETWRFQVWFRDPALGGGVTSSFTNGVQGLFL